VKTLLLALMAVPALSHAQDCFRGRPLPTCRSFWITESGIAKRVNPNATGDTDDFLATLEVGRMRNRSNRTALGATAVFGIGSQLGGGTDVMLGVKARYRRWVSTTTSFELAPGALVVPSTGKVALTGHAAINLSDYAAVTAQVLAGRDGAGKQDVGAYLGVKLGSHPGVIAAIAAPLAALGFLLLGGTGD
jgi:hypothetical protein